MFEFLGLGNRKPEPKLWCFHPRKFRVRDVEGQGQKGMEGKTLSEWPAQVPF